MIDVLVERFDCKVSSCGRTHQYFLGHWVVLRLSFQSACRLVGYEKDCSLCHQNYPWSDRGVTSSIISRRFIP